MFRLLKFLFLCALAVVAGVAAVSVPVAGKTVAGHVQSWLDAPPAGAPAGKAATTPAAPREAAAKRAPASRQPPIEGDPTKEEREALEKLIGTRVARPPAQGR